MRISTTVSASARSRESDSFLLRAHSLLDAAEEAWSAGDMESAVESAYRSALRTAGAVLSSSPGSGRRRRGGAWESLRRIGGTQVRWAAVFSGYSPLYARLSSGLSVALSAGTVRSLLTAAGDFLAEVEGPQSASGTIAAAA